MKRHFYTDPLAAAWMAKHHGFHLYTGHFDDDMDAYSQVNWWHCVDDAQYRLKHGGYIAKFYIQPDSSRLLEPQVGDLIKQWGCLAGVPIYDVAEKGGKSAYFMPDGSYNHFDSLEHIISRNGIPFMWPQSEESGAV